MTQGYRWKRDHEPVVPRERKERLLRPYVGPRAYGRLIMIWVGIATIAVFWDAITKIIKF